MKKPGFQKQTRNSSFPAISSEWRLWKTNEP
jgi:hypothetical protein